MSSDVSTTVALDSSAPEQKGEEESQTKPQADALGGSNHEKASLDTPAESAEPVEGGVGVCQFFLKGKCRFGHRCRLSHSNPTLDDAGVVLLNQEDMKNGDNEGKHKKRKSKDYSAAKPKESEENGSGSNKKPRMRTAEEVIHRILWDPSVQGSEFVVGYVDRFLGVLERPFSEFNWDANPCDWDHAAELALPQHRIQYFIYRGRRVWDRNSRTDRVFGSTGQPLAPPFGGEEEVEAEQRDGDQSTCAGTIQPEEGQQESDANIHPPDSTRPAPNDTGSAPQGHQEAGRESLPEETAKRLETLTDRMSLAQREREMGESNGVEVSLEECNESCEDKTEEEQSPNGKCHGDQRGQADRGSRPTKRRPTHFVGFRADTPSILSAFQKLREELTALLPSSAPLWRPASKLHVTLCLLSLPGPAEVAAAGGVLRRFAEWDRNPPVAVAFPVKPKHFNGKVLYLSPQPQNQLQQLNSGLQEAFAKEGWLHRDSFNPRYHLTLAKVEARGRERPFEGVGELRVGKGLNFGRLPVNTLHLCAMGVTVADDGFYHTLCTVSLSTRETSGRTDGEKIEGERTPPNSTVQGW